MKKLCALTLLFGMTVVMLAPLGGCTTEKKTQTPTTTTPAADKDKDKDKGK